MECSVYSPDYVNKRKAARSRRARPSPTSPSSSDSGYLSAGSSFSPSSSSNTAGSSSSTTYTVPPSSSSHNVDDEDPLSDLFVSAQHGNTTCCACSPCRRPCGPWRSSALFEEDVEADRFPGVSASSSAHHAHLNFENRPISARQRCSSTAKSRASNTGRQLPSMAVLQDPLSELPSTVPSLSCGLPMGYKSAPSRAKSARRRFKSINFSSLLSAAWWFEKQTPTVLPPSLSIDIPSESDSPSSVQMSTIPYPASPMPCLEDAIAQTAYPVARTVTNSQHLVMQSIETLMIQRRKLRAPLRERAFRVTHKHGKGNLSPLRNQIAA